MDCSQTRDGWFEFETLFTNGGEGGENDIVQQTCDGDVGGSEPVQAAISREKRSHSAICTPHRTICLTETGNARAKS